MSAYACDPDAGSEPQAGWQWARAAAQRHDVWLLTRANNAPALRAALAREPTLRLHPIYLDLPRWARWWKRGPRGVRLYYLLWQLAVARAAPRLHRELGFDVLHHVTFATDWMPTGLVAVRGVPLVWGPVGGAARSPLTAWRWVGWRYALRDLVGLSIAGWARRTVGRRMARRAALTVAQTPATAAAMAGSRRVVVEPIVAVDPPGQSRALTATSPSDTSQRRAVFVGRLIPRKAVVLAVAALAHPVAHGWQLDVYGDGPDGERAQRLAHGLGVADRVRFHGTVPRPTVLTAIASADALLHPSLHDQAPFAVAEAVAAGTPVVCFAGGGPATILGDGRGVTVPTGPDPVARIARALADLPPPGPPDPRWAPARLPDLLDRWYREVTSTIAAPAAPRERR